MTYKSRATSLDLRFTTSRRRIFEVTRDGRASRQVEDAAYDLPTAYRVFVAALAGERIPRLELGGGIRIGERERGNSAEGG